MAHCTELLEMLEVLAKPSERERIKSLRARAAQHRISPSDIPWTVAQLEDIGRKFNVRPVQAERDPRRAILRGLWAAGILQQLGLDPDASLEFDVKYGKRTVTPKERTSFAFQLEMIKKGGVR